MSESLLGTIITSDHKRDAIHVAIVPMVAAETLLPGQKIGRVDASTLKASASAVKIIGIVDPFLTKPVHSGEWFYLCLFPGTVTGMRHHWMHPEFVVDSVSTND